MVTPVFNLRREARRKRQQEEGSNSGVQKRRREKGSVRSSKRGRKNTAACEEQESATVPRRKTLYKEVIGKKSSLGTGAFFWEGNSRGKQIMKERRGGGQQKGRASS